jgi:hypothetical protein
MLWRGQGERRARVRKKKDAEFESRFVYGQAGIGEFAFALLLLKLGLDDVGMGSLALLFPLCCKRHEVVGLGAGLFGDCEAAIRSEHSIEKPADRGNEAAAGDLELRRGHGGTRIGAAHVRNLAYPDGLVDNALAVIFVEEPWEEGVDRPVPCVYKYWLWKATPGSKADRAMERSSAATRLSATAVA